MAVSDLICFSFLVVSTLAYPYYNDIPEAWLDNNGYTGPREDPRWPHVALDLGQVAGVATGSEGKVHLFHRNERRWGPGTFLINNSFANPSEGAIKGDTITMLDGRTGEKISSLGKDKFYMPHGLTVDNSGNMWLTDVALHQVMRIPAGAQEPDLILGKKLEPGSDDEHFCKPTDVAVAGNGDFFVSDGYCNSRVMKFAANGTLLKTWKEHDNYGLRIPHSLALMEKFDMVCVADRENARVQCYNAGMKDADKTGELIGTLFPADAIGNVYAIAFDPTKDVLYAVVNPASSPNRFRGFTMTVDATGPSSLLEEWWMDREETSLPHDVAISPDGMDIYVGDIGAGRVVKLRRVAPLSL